MNTYIAIRTNDGAAHILKAKDADGAYRLYAKVILGLEDADKPEFDTGNADIDLYLLPREVAAGEVPELRQE